MPYIRQNERDVINKLVDELPIMGIGNINYTVSRIIHGWLIKSGPKLKYDRINQVIGVFECAKLELYRQIAAPYEDIKKNENGAVSGLDGSY